MSALKYLKLFLLILFGILGGIVFIAAAFTGGVALYRGDIIPALFFLVGGYWMLVYVLEAIFK